MPTCSVARSGIRFATVVPMRRSRSLGCAGGTSISGCADWHHPTTCETWIWLNPKVRGIRGLASRKNGTRPISDATYSAFVPRLKKPWASGMLAAAITSEQRVPVRSSRGTSQKWLGTRSRCPAQYGGWVTADSK
jgi:hypothetical protein